MEIGLVWFTAVILVVTGLSIGSKIGLGSLELLEWDERTFPKVSHLFAFIITAICAMIPLSLYWYITIPLSIVVIWDISRRAGSTNV